MKCHPYRKRSISRSHLLIPTAPLRFVTVSSIDVRSGRKCQLIILQPNSLREMTPTRIYLLTSNYFPSSLPSPCFLTPSVSHHVSLQTFLSFHPPMINQFSQTDTGHTRFRSKSRFVVPFSRYIECGLAWLMIVRTWVGGWVRRAEGLCMDTGRGWMDTCSGEENTNSAFGFWRRALRRVDDWTDEFEIGAYCVVVDNVARKRWSLAWSAKEWTR